MQSIFDSWALLCSNFHHHRAREMWGAGHEEEARALQVWPLDEHNIATLDAVRPRGWEDPPPAAEYDLIAIGAGAGGLVAAKQSGRRGARSAMISEHLAGGDCLNVGCVPSKALLRCARAIKEVRRAAEFGVVILGPPPTVDFGAIMDRMRRLRAAIAPADAHVATAAAGVDVFQGRGRFTGPNTIEVNGATLRFKKAVIATGGRATVPDVPGLATAPYVTNATLYNLTSLPERLVVLGCGTIALEMAQAFAAFGSQVTCVQRGARLLPRSDADAAAAVHAALTADGVAFELGVQVEKVTTLEGGRMCVRVARGGGGGGGGGEVRELECDVLLVATGRRPNVEGLGLEEAGVAYSADGVQAQAPHAYRTRTARAPHDAHRTTRTARRAPHDAQRTTRTARRAAHDAHRTRTARALPTACRSTRHCRQATPACSPWETASRASAASRTSQARLSEITTRAGHTHMCSYSRIRPRVSAHTSAHLGTSQQHLGTSRQISAHHIYIFSAHHIHIHIYICIYICICICIHISPQARWPRWRCRTHSSATRGRCAASSCRRAPTPSRSSPRWASRRRTPPRSTPT